MYRYCAISHRCQPPVVVTVGSAPATDHARRCAALGSGLRGWQEAAQGSRHGPRLGEWAGGSWRAAGCARTGSVLRLVAEQLQLVPRATPLELPDPATVPAAHARWSRLAVHGPRFCSCDSLQLRPRQSKRCVHGRQRPEYTAD